MDTQDLRRWRVKDTEFSDWRELPGEFTSIEIWEMRVRGDFWIAIPVREEVSAKVPASREVGTVQSLEEESSPA